MIRADIESKITWNWNLTHGKMIEENLVNGWNDLFLAAVDEDE